jgi:signal transduction histidine kinase/DNA-binding response OmpR family regulator
MIAIFKDRQEELEEANRQLEAANEQANRMAVEAESATRSKSEFLANMSHEIRTPMMAVLGYADVLLEEIICCPVCPDSTHCHQRRSGAEMVATIKRNGEHLLKVIGDILDLSKIEAGKLQIELSRCSPVQLVAEVVSVVCGQAAAKQLELKTELADSLPETVLTDPLRLRQVLVNLLGNAIKFTGQGEVRLAVRLTSDSGTPRLCFDVTDTGIGMNEQQVGKLFQPFTQADSSTTREFGGTGLGLCISKHLAEALGGNIEVRSNPGKGSTFIVSIDPGPLDGMHMIQNAHETLLDRPPARTAATPDKIILDGRILLAEDGLDNQRLIAMLLTKAGAEVTAVENGQLAVLQALAAREQDRPFHAILMDIQMPVLDGYAATRQLRQLGYTGPIIALTANTMAEDCQKCLDAGCNDYATKPIGRQKLLATVALWTARGRTHPDSPDSSISDSQASTTMLPTFVYSDLVADPDLRELVDLFVQDMPNRINALDAHAKSRDWIQLARTAHQIKGAAGSYGFGEITTYAARLETAAMEAQQEQQTLRTLDELVSLCRRVRSGNPKHF